MSKKIAFIALTYNTFQKEELMRRFFDKQYSDRFNLYIHPKVDLNADSLFTSYCIPYNERVHNTEWGYFSLVEATIALLRHGLKDPSNEKFILISDSHLPLYNINDMCDRLWEEADVTCFNVYDTDRFAAHRFFKMFRLQKMRAIMIPISMKAAMFVSQWFVCTRKDAAAFVDAYDKMHHLFDKDTLTLADECWFGTIANHAMMPWKNRSFCFSDWYWETEQYMVDRGCKKNPHTFGVVTQGNINKYRADGNMFIRKIHSSTLVDEDYLLRTQKYK
jgi:hypothetical protein